MVEEMCIKKAMSCHILTMDLIHRRVSKQCAKIMAYVKLEKKRGCVKASKRGLDSNAILVMQSLAIVGRIPRSPVPASPHLLALYLKPS